MLVTIVAIFCHSVAAGADDYCIEQVITDQATMQSCAIHQQIGVADWLSSRPAFSRDWHLHKVRCVAGKYEPKRHI
jgi:hypothetical protein